MLGVMCSGCVRVACCVALESSLKILTISVLNCFVFHGNSIEGMLFWPKLGLMLDFGCNLRLVLVEWVLTMFLWF